MIDHNNELQNRADRWEVIMIKRYRTLTATALCALTLQGCTTNLKVHPLTAGNTDNRQGVPYFLPFTQFDTKLTWIPGCVDTEVKKDGEPVLDENRNRIIRKDVLNVRVKTSLTPTTRQDPTALYLIDYTSMSSALKTSSVSAEFYSGTGFLKSINAEADDKTGEVILSTVSALGKLALLGAGPAEGLDETKKAYYVCSPQLKTALSAIKMQAAKLANATKTLNANKRKLQAIQKKIASANGVADEATKATLSELLTTVRNNMSVLNDEQAALSELQAATYVSKSLKFPETSLSRERVIKDPISEATWKKWALLKVPDVADPMQIEKGDLNNLLGLKRVVLKLSSEWFAKTKPSVGQPDPEMAAEAGIRYRMGLPATVMTCVSKDGTCKDGKAAKGETLDSQQVSMKHAGTNFYLPFTSRAFTNASLTASFAKDGTITAFGYQNKKAAAAEAASTADSALETILGIEPAKRARYIKQLEDEATIREKEKAAKEAELEALQDMSEASDDPAVEAEMADVDADIASSGVQSLVAELEISVE